MLSSVADPSGQQCPPASGRGETCVCQADGGFIDITECERGVEALTKRTDPAMATSSELKSLDCLPPDVIHNVTTYLPAAEGETGS